MAGVSGLLVSEPRTEMDWSAFGVTLHEQQAASSSAGSNVYTFYTQILADPVSHRCTGIGDIYYRITDVQV
jgi:hypothetical protein